MTAAATAAVLRTPEQCFAALPDFAFEPHYLHIEDDAFGSLRMHYLDLGDPAAPVIFALHGQASWCYSFRHLIPAWLAAGYRVIAPDMPGFGRSDKPAQDTDYHFYRHVQWLQQFVQALGLRDAHAFLFDWGGYFGLPLAIREPKVFASLTLLNTTLPRGKGLINALWVAWWRRHLAKKEQFPQADMVQQMTDSELSDSVWQAYEAPYPDERYKAGPRRLPYLIPATGRNPASAPNRQVWAQLANWQQPTLTVVSERLSRRGFSPAAFHRQIPGCAGQPHLLVANAGFFLLEDGAEVIVERHLQFLQQNFAAP